MNDTAMFVGPDAIMSAYESLRGDNCCWSVWGGNRKRFQFVDNDKDAGEDMLRTILQAGGQSGNTELLEIRIHESGDRVITNKTPYLTGLNVRTCELPGKAGRVAGSGGYSDEMRLPAPVYNMMQNINAKLPEIAQQQLSINARLEALEKGNTKEPDVFDRIGSILEKQGMPELLGKFIEMIPGLLGGNASPVANIPIGQVRQDLVPLNNAMPDRAPGNTAQNRDVAGDIIPAPIAEKSDRILSDNLLSNIAESSDTAVDVLPYTSEENAIIDTAIARLSSHIDLVEYLPLMADFADNDPGMFAFFVTQLKAKK